MRLPGSPSGSMRDLQKQLADKKIVAFAAAFQIDAPPLGAPTPPPTVVDPKTGEETSDPALEEIFAAKDSDWRKVKDQAFADLKILVNGQSQKVTSAGSLDSAASGFTHAFTHTFTPAGVLPSTQARRH